MNAIELLTRQHRELEHQLERLNRLAPEEVEAKRGHLAGLADRLALHLAVEEMHLYPAVEDPSELQTELLHGHLSMKRLLADLLELEPTDPAFDSSVNLLREQIEAHVESQEEGLFPVAEAQLPPERQLELGADIEATRAELKASQIQHEPPGEALGRSTLH